MINYHNLSIQNHLQQAQKKHFNFLITKKNFSIILENFTKLNRINNLNDETKTNKSK